MSWLAKLTGGVSGSVLKLIRGFDSLVGNATPCSLAGAVTYATGDVFINHFEAGGTSVNNCPAAFQRQFRRELTRSHRAAQQPQVQVSGSCGTATTCLS